MTLLVRVRTMSVSVVWGASPGHKLLIMDGEASRAQADKLLRGVVLLVNGLCSSPQDKFNVVVCVCGCVF